jgi:hypothetical protein
MSNKSPVRAKYDEMLLAARPLAPQDRSDQPTERSRRYEVRVYGDVPDLGGAQRLPQREPAAAIGGLGFATAEELAVRWCEYAEYLELFRDPAATPRLFRNYLVPSAGLDRLLMNALARPRLRIWLCTEAPELVELPWELLPWTTPEAGRSRCSLARGIPGDFAPLLPLGGRLRLGLIGADAAHPEVAAALRQAGGAVTVIELDDPPAAALRRAAADGIELLHVVADGEVSLGEDGVLQLARGIISPREVRLLLTGSRVTILSLSPPRAPDNRCGAPSVFRAFAHLGSTAQSSASVVAPTGPMSPMHEAAFWRRFYQRLADSLSVEEAIATAQEGVPLPIALFLSHRLGVQFSRRAANTPEDPARLNAELKAARKFLQHVAGSGERDGGDSLRESNQRLDVIDESLDAWRNLEGDDR